MIYCCCCLSISGYLDYMKPYIDSGINMDNSPSSSDLGITYRLPEEAIVNFAYFLIKNGAIPNKGITDDKFNSVLNEEKWD